MSPHQNLPSVENLHISQSDPKGIMRLSWNPKDHKTGDGVTHLTPDQPFAWSEGKKSAKNFFASIVSGQDEFSTTLPLCSFTKLTAQKKGDLISIGLEFASDCRIYGLGAAPGKFLRLGQKQQLMNFDTNFYSVPETSYSTFPFYLFSIHGNFWAMLVNSSLPARSDVTCSNERSLSHTLELHGNRDELVIYFFTGDLPSIMKNLSAITGRAMMPPIWALGYHQSRWSYKSASEVLTLAKQFRKMRLPLDAIYLDIHYMDRYRVFTWNQKRFANMKIVNNQLLEMGVRTVAIVDPGVAIADDYLVHTQGKHQQIFCKQESGENFIGKVWPGATHFPDFFTRKAQSFWAAWHYEIFKEGVSGIWNDMNDPVLLLKKDFDPRKSGMVHDRRTPHIHVRNLYANKQAEATIEAFARWLPGQRPFILSRSAFPGMQKWAGIWTGDNYASWDQLQENLAMVLNLGLSGIGFSGADVGGFASRKGIFGIVKIAHNRELFARWMQLGAWMPFFRAHTSLFSTRQEPWTFGNEVLEISRKTMLRRLKFLPYLYTLLFENRKLGSPLIRPLFYHYPNISQEAYPYLDKSFLVGEYIFVVPVMESQIQEISFFLPPGTWYDYNTGKTIVGDSIIRYPVSLDSYPLFIKAGAVLPVCRPESSAKDSFYHQFALNIYPDSELRGSFYCDDLDSLGYTQGQYQHWQISGSSESLRFQKKHLGYKIPLKKIILHLPGNFQLHDAQFKKRLDISGYENPSDWHSYKAPWPEKSMELQLKGT